MRPECIFVKLTSFTDYSLRVLIHLAAAPETLAVVPRLRPR